MTAGGEGLSRPPTGLGRAVRLEVAGWSVRARPRAAVAVTVLAALVFLLVVAGILVGGPGVALSDVPAALAGQGDMATTYVVQSVRLPRVGVAVLAGLALGASGMLFQNIGRNPLASPDMIGFTAGASAGAVLQILVFDAGAAAVAAGAVAGGLLTGLAVYLLAHRTGLHGQRLVVVGVGLAAMLLACTYYLLARADRTEVRVAAEWLTGSLNGRTWEHAVPLAVMVALSLPALAVLMPRLRALELGDDSARSLGVDVERARLAALLVGVGLASGAVAAAGPIPFIALAAPQLAARITRGSPTALWPAALCGAVLLLGGDALTQQLFPGAKLPVGVVTGALGGIYLASLVRRGGRAS
ncbi:FecCD family ABC transporter permease [Streptosporangium sp. NPDC000396]|uniref:FecCD family ABC transporter permease n=1 Tax=Streptosporangium sp. NPDC000396 TaxID=3366185 RepID=UPI00369E3E27